MKTEAHGYYQTVEATCDPDTIVRVTQDDRDKFTITVASPGSKIAAVRISGLSELQIKDLVQQCVRLL